MKLRTSIYKKNFSSLRLYLASFLYNYQNRGTFRVHYYNRETLIDVKVTLQAYKCVPLKVTTSFPLCFNHAIRLVEEKKAYIKDNNIYLVGIPKKVPFFDFVGNRKLDFSLEPQKFFRGYKIFSWNGRPCSELVNATLDINTVTHVFADPYNNYLLEAYIKTLLGFNVPKYGLLGTITMNKNNCTESSELEFAKYDRMQLMRSFSNVQGTFSNEDLIESKFDYIAKTTDLKVK